jgi:hypothetical protein
MALEASMTREFDMTVLGGLPVTIEFTTTGYDNTDVGLGVDDVDEWWITAIGGRSKRKLDWLYKRIAKSKGEEERILEQCYSHKES